MLVNVFVLYTLGLVTLVYNEEQNTFNLRFVEFGTKPSKEVYAYKQARWTILWIPLVNQLMTFSRSLQWKQPIIMDCNKDSKSDFSNANACEKWQPIRFSQV